MAHYHRGLPSDLQHLNQTVGEFEATMASVFTQLANTPASSATGSNANSMASAAATFDAESYCSSAAASDPASAAAGVCASLAYIDDTNAGLDAGFAMLCAGSIRRKNVVNIMLKNFLDPCGGALGFWSVGYAFSYGGASPDKKGFIGTSGFFLADESFADGSALIAWFHQFGFAAAAATIVAGSVAERCKFEAYLFYSLMLTGFICPVVVYSIWSDSGFLSPFNDDPPFGCGMIDFAGSGVVHVTGGATALIATTILGSRIGRFCDAAGHELYEPNNFPPYSVALQALGTFLLVVGWFGFNPGSTLAISSKAYGDAAALAAVTTVLGATSAAVCAMITDMILNRRKTGLVFYDTTMSWQGSQCQYAQAR